MTNKKTFTKIRKWAEAKGYEVKDSNHFDEITVIINSDLSFTIANKESTIYRSIKGGLKGTAKGIYMSVNNIENRRRGFSFQYRSQKEMIEKMEAEIEKIEVKEVEVEVSAKEVEEEVAVAIEEVEVNEEVEEEKMPNVKILTERQEIAKALNFGKYPVLSYDLDKEEGSLAKVNSRRGDFSYRCQLYRGKITKDDGIFYLLTKPSVMTSSFGVNDCLEMIEYANAPTIEANQEVAILVHSKKANIYYVQIVKSGRVDGMCSTATTFESEVL